jgi:hypothetical protein
MNEMSLSRLYRRLTSGRARDAVDAAELVDAMAHDGADGERRTAVAAKLAVSPPHADLARVQAPHLRWASGIAACLAVVFGLWSWHGAEMQRGSEVAGSAARATTSDRIFTMQDRIFATADSAGARGHARDNDKVFSGSFSRGG